MLHLLEYEVSASTGIRLHTSMGSVIHGVLMEQLGNEWGTALHEMAVRPFQQYLFFDRKRKIFIWRMGVIDDGLFEALSEILQSRKLYIKKHECDLCLSGPTILDETTFDKLAAQAFTTECLPYGCRLTLHTPTTCKHDGSYDVFPDLSRIFYGLNNKWNAFSEDLRLEQEGLETILGNACKIGKYELRSALFSLEGARVGGYEGMMQLYFRGNEMTRRIVMLLLMWASFTGIGIKTALGMGGCSCGFLYKE